MKIKWVSISIFLVFIFTSSIQAIHPFIRIPPIKQQETLAPFPKDAPLKGILTGHTYTTRVEQYYSDHFPLRDLFLRSLGQFEFSYLKRSNEVVIGKNGWLSDKKVLLDQLPQLDQKTDQQIEFALLNIKRLQENLKSRGIDFLMVIVPMKATIYPEEFPGKSLKRVNPTTLDRFQAALGRNNVPYIDVKALFKQKKSNEPLYYKTDIHWNTLGAAIVAKAIVNYLSEKYVGKDIWQERFERSVQDFSGDELASIPLLFPKPEKVPVLTAKDQSFTKTIDTSYPSPVEVYKATNNQIGVLPPMLMFGNSFMLNYPSVGLANYFSESTRVLDYQFFSHVLDYIRPGQKTFILNIYETQLLFHILPPDDFGYWDKRIAGLPLPTGFLYH